MDDDFFDKCGFRFQCVLFILLSVYIYWGLDTFVFSVIEPDAGWDGVFFSTWLTLMVLMIFPIFFGFLGAVNVLFIAYLLFEGVVYCLFLFSRFLFRLVRKHLFDNACKLPELGNVGVTVLSIEKPKQCTALSSFAETSKMTPKEIAEGILGWLFIAAIIWGLYSLLP